MAECDATADEQAETAKLLARQRSAGASYEGIWTEAQPSH